MKFTLTIACDNSAFFTGKDQDVFEPDYELARLLHLAGERVQHGEFEFSMKDINGTTVARAILEDA